jgi:uncharacterized protein
MNEMSPPLERNVFGDRLEPCSFKPLTGFFRDGSCACGSDGSARHLVCVEMTADFLEFSKSRGNDLTTPSPDYKFPGLVAGDRWCLHVLRWIEAFDAGMAPRVALRSTNQVVLRFVEIEKLKAYALDLS